MRGLLGKKLSHSFSKQIHEKLDKKPYNLIETDDIGAFFHESTINAINVTIPYKEEVIPFLDKIDPLVAETKSCNTIVNKDGVLYGYNTDYDGFKFLCEYHNISLSNKTVGIIGNGSTSSLIQKLCSDQKANKILVFARHPKANQYPLTDIETHSIEVLINATPVGMFPNNTEEHVFSLSAFSQLQAVIDVVYNPLRTRLILEAQTLNIKAVNGLMMLIHQAVKANELFNDCTYPKSTTTELYQYILKRTMNITLIGMPMSGKTYYAKQIASIYNKDVVDLDNELEKKHNKTIPDIFQNYGESWFRDEEKSICESFSKLNNKAISTGGGVILNTENIKNLKQNGPVLFLDMPLQSLLQCNPKDRPLLQDKKNIEILFNTRYNIYLQECDYRIIKRGFNEKPTLRQIEVKINEYLCS